MPGAAPAAKRSARERARRLQLDRVAQLGLSAFGIASPVRGQTQVDVAHVAPRQPAPLADVQNLRTERLHERQVTEHRRLADPVHKHHERCAEVTEPFGDAQRLVGRA